jgi:hypothetical protein
MDSKEGIAMTKDEARQELLETLEEYCHDKGYGLQVFAGMADWVYTLYPKEKTMTNREWLAKMTNEQLAEFIDEQVKICNYCSDHPDTCDCNCAPNIQRWLESEHKENSND